jgi:hypothetical protein
LPASPIARHSVSGCRALPYAPADQSLIAEALFSNYIRIACASKSRNTNRLRFGKRMAVALIAADGTVLETAAPPRFGNLPLVVGQGAEQSAQGFLAIVARYPAIAHATDASVLVAERRWSLHLKGGIEILLPEREPEKALRTLIDLERSNKLLSRDIVAIDLRLSDRVTIRQSDNAAAARDRFSRMPRKRRRARRVKEAKHDRAALRSYSKDETGFAKARSCRRWPRHRNQQNRLPDRATRAASAATRTPPP